MVSTFQIKPASLLQPFVNCYALRIFNSENGLLKPHYAQPEHYLSFLLKKDKSCSLIDDSGHLRQKLSNTLIGLITESQGCVSFKGNFYMFSVQFKANGLFAIFGIPQKMLLNAMLPVEDVIGNDHRLLTEQLESSEGIAEMGVYMNVYLTKKLLAQKHKVHTNAITCASADILRNKGNVSIDALAVYVNMSLRNFERRFIEEIGITPKLYMRIIRFYNAIENKLAHPHKRWIDISYESGYFDQMHFIKEVKTFSSKTPSELFNETPPPRESVIQG